MQIFIIQINHAPAPDMIKIDIGGIKEVKSNMIRSKDPYKSLWTD